MTRVKDGHPGKHAKYLVERDGFLFTATPCYGLHAPWWVVKTMEGEAEPVAMLPDDAWCPIEEARLRIVGKETDREAILYAFAIEPTHDRATLERYLRQYPELAEDLVDLSSELRLGEALGPSPVAEDPGAEAAWREFKEASDGRPI